MDEDYNLKISPQKNPHENIIAIFYFNACENERSFHVESMRKCESLNIRVLSPWTALLSWDSKEEFIGVLHRRVYCSLRHCILKCLTRTDCYLEVVVSKVTLRAIEFFIEMKPALIHDVQEANAVVRIQHKDDVKEILGYLYSKKFIDCSDVGNLTHSVNIDRLYELIYQNRQEQSKTDCLTNLDSDSLVSILRPYQLQAVTWMLNIENGKSADPVLHPSFFKMKTIDNKIFYVHLYHLYVTTKKFFMQPMTGAGILADEMGLGKTIEVLLLSVLNPRSLLHENDQPEKARRELMELDLNVNQMSTAVDSALSSCTCGDNASEIWIKRECQNCGIIQHPECILRKPDLNAPDYLCPMCSIADTVTSRATLIISPRSICQQWKDEVAKHFKHGTMKVFIYRGVKEQKFIPPSVLADYDIVLTTYEVLTAELNHSKVHANYGTEARSTRYPKKYYSLPTPLTAVGWWRICLDEAQMVESTTSKSAEMALNLKAVNRWCVTGTPVQKTIEDIHGLLCFLNYEPYVHKRCWKELLSKPFIHGNLQYMVNALLPVFWRTNKKNVEDQLNIPVKCEVTTELIFSSVEAYFYQKLQDSCETTFVENVERYGELESLDRRTLNKVLKPLSKLRCACVHPQAVKSEFVRVKKTLTMQEVCSQLVLEAEYDCQETHRQLIASLNGLAGCYILQGHKDAAIEIYKEVLQSAKDHSEIFKTDSVQQIHALDNMLDCMKQSDNPSSSNPSVDDIDEQLQKLKSDFLTKYIEEVKTSANKLDNLQLEFKELNKSLELRKWCPLFICISQYGDEDLVNTVKDAFQESSKTSLMMPLQTPAGVGALCSYLLENLKDSRKDLIRSVKDLKKVPNAFEVATATECHLRPVQGAEKCKICKCEILINNFENEVFDVQNKNTRGTKRKSPEDNENESPMTGTWADGTLQKILKILLPVLQKISKELYDECTNCLGDLEATKKEFNAMRALWLAAKEFDAATEEVEMSTIRHRLRTYLEKEKNVPANVLDTIESVEIHDLKADRILQNWKLKSQMGKLNYLKNLIKVYDTDVPSVECCPRCAVALDSEWCVLYCGHILCNSCLEAIKCKTSQNVPCAVCWKVVPMTQVSFVKMKNSANNESSQGGYSAKITAIVGCLIKLKNEEPTTKTLVFSTWPHVLHMIQYALDENGIPYLNLSKSNDFQTSLKLFKSSKTVNVLLMPLKTDGNRLNIVEASHVIFVEPSLYENVEDEAVRCVYRMGQTKPTVVHHFYIKGTIEERILKLEKNVFLTVFTEEIERPFNELLSLVKTD